VPYLLLLLSENRVLPIGLDHDALAGAFLGRLDGIGDQ
jgi:hypothetical protein